MASSNAADQAVAFARSKIGTDYVFGADGPNNFDCSGLTHSAYRSAGVTIGRTTYQQILNGTAVAKTELRIGDLVFPDAGHVQLYVGGGKIVEAPHTGAKVREVAMWGFWRARRVVEGGGTGSATLINTTPILSPLDALGPAGQLAEALAKGAGFFQLLATPGTYKRVGAIATGGIMVLIGVSLMGGPSLGSVTQAAKVVKKVAK